jgi:type I restriction enzyme S subunit
MLVGWITPCLENGKTAFVNFFQESQVGFASTQYIVLHPGLPLPEEFAYCLACSQDLRECAIESLARSSNRQRVPAESLAHFQLALPPQPATDAIGRAVTAKFARASAAVREARSIAAPRATLRPKLISGELRGKHAQEATRRPTRWRLFE